VDLLVEALDQRQRILIVGDFDADGATASTVGVLGLRLLGAAHVDYLVPNRFEYGYGLTPEIVEVALQRQPQLLITVDNGISSVDGVAAAKAAGLKVLVTDHHLPGEQLPGRCHRQPEPARLQLPEQVAGRGGGDLLRADGPARSLAQPWPLRGAAAAEHRRAARPGGAGQRRRRGAAGCQQPHPGAPGPRAHPRRPRPPGLKAILEVARRDHRRITSTDLGFILGPRLNAAGRLDDMSLGIECLLCEDAALAQDMAQQLDGLNQDRKSIEQGMQREALAQLKDLPVESMPYGLCLFDADWHQG
jgi:single-stranded-DNA-specific exonuclease